MSNNNFQPKAHTPRDEDKVNQAEPVAIVETPDPALIVEKVETLATPIPLRGVVTDCLKLNVRSTPENDPKNGNVIGTVECLTWVQIDEAASTEEFYKVKTESGLEGFCMKKYIAIERQQ